jgi:zinc protease
VRREVLGNGLTLLVREMRSAPIVALNLWVGVGSVDDPPGLGGIAHFLEHMLLKGTSDGAAGRLASLVQASGGYLNAGTACDHTKYYQVVPSESWADVLEAQVEVVTSPTFGLDEVAGERKVVLEESRMAEREPASLTWHRLMEAALGDTPYGRPITGSEDTLARIGADELAEHHASRYRPDRMVQVVVGDVDVDDVVERAAPLLESIGTGSDAPGGDQRPRAGERTAGCWNAGASVVAGPVSDAYLLAAFRVPGAINSDIPALDVSAGLLGLGRSSRLRKRLISSRPLASNVTAGVVAYRDLGLLVVRATGVSGSDPVTMASAVFEELDALRSAAVGPEEMAKILRRVETGYVLEHETVESVAGTLGFFETVGDYSYAEEYVDRLAGVSAADVLEVTRKHLEPSGATVVACVSDDGARRPDAGALAAAVGAALAGEVGEDVESWGEAGSSLREERGCDRGEGLAFGAPAAFTRPKILMERRTPRTSRSDLPGGGSLVVCHIEGLPAASIAMGFAGGAVEEDTGLSGLTSLMVAHMLRGTETRDAARLADDIELLGGGIVTSVDRDGFGFGTTVVSSRFREALELMFEVVARPALAPTEFEVVRARSISEIGAAEDHPFRSAVLKLLPLVFPDHPYGRPVIGTRESVSSVAASATADWHAGRVAADRLSLSVVGDVGASDVMEEVLRWLEGVRPRGLPIEVEPGSFGPRGRVEGDHRQSGQSSVAVGFGGPRAGTTDAAALMVAGRAATMMGGRLWRALRERPPHAYAVRAAPVAMARSGAFVGYVTTPPGGEEAALEVFVSELRGLRESGVPPEELDRAKKSLSGSLRISMQRGAVRAASYALAETMGVGSARVDRLPEVVSAISNEDIIAAAGRYVSAEDEPAVVVLRG